MISKGNILITVLASSLVCSACAVTVRPAGPPPRAEVVYAVRQPPPDRIEVIPAAPADDFIWVQGHWVWRANRNDYEWSAGHWQQLDAGQRAWVPGHWVQEPRGWRFVDGHFESVAYFDHKPPPPREEVVVITRPSAEHVWIKGYWAPRNGQVEWVAGHWARPEPGFHAWVDGRWEHEPHGWFFVEGHWKA